jgi:hypothetical protein
MPRRNVTLADKIASLEKIKNQPPDTCHRQLGEITGVLKSSIARAIQQKEKLQCGHYAMDNRKLPKNGSVKVRMLTLKRSSIVTGRGIRVSCSMLKSKSEDLATELGHNDFKTTDDSLSRWKCAYEIKFKKHKARRAMLML